MRQFDPITVALTGQLFFILVVAAVLALITSYLLLRLYRRAVIKSMRRIGSSELLETKGYLPRNRSTSRMMLRSILILPSALPPTPTVRLQRFIEAPFAAAGSRFSST